MVDCQFVSAMGPPGGGRNFVTPRFARHFHHVSICELDNRSMTCIFGTILGTYLKQVPLSSLSEHRTSRQLQGFADLSTLHTVMCQRHLACPRTVLLFHSLAASNHQLDLPHAAVQNAFAESIVGFKDDIVQATIDVYNTSMASLLPTPTKSHYLFNLRDVARVIGGMLMLQQPALADIKGPKVKYVRLWVHEVLRVFYDRCGMLHPTEPPCLPHQPASSLLLAHGSGICRDGGDEPTNRYPCLLSIANCT